MTTHSSFLQPRNRRTTRPSGPGRSNTTDGNNMALGFNALFSNSTGSGNTANGVQRSKPTAPATTTAIGDENSKTTSSATTTRPTGLWRSIPTQSATTTRPSVLMRSLTTRPAITTSHWALVPATVSPRVTTISISATRVSLVSQALSALATQIRQPPISRVSAASHSLAHPLWSMRADTWAQLISAPYKALPVQKDHKVRPANKANWCARPPGSNWPDRTRRS